MKISLIVAKDKNNCIGKNGDLPWKISADLKYFKKLTTNNVVIMGRKTFESIGKPLPNRINVVITKNKDLKIEGCKVVNSINAAFAYATQFSDKEIFIIGGGQIYKETINEATNLYITEVDFEVENGDTFFPIVDNKLWIETSRNTYLPEYANPIGYSFVNYERRF